MNLLNIKNNIYKKILCLIPLSLLYFPPSQAELKLIEFEDSDSLVRTILQESSNTLGKRVGAKEVNWKWGKEGESCDHYNHYRGEICLSENLKNQDLVLAFVTAHEYAHHVQWSAFNLPRTNKWREAVNILKLELQADCFAGIVLASIPNFYITPDDATKMIAIVEEFGDDNYDGPDHHGSGENRSLAHRSGLRFGASKGAWKDHYYKVFCAGDVLK